MRTTLCRAMILFLVAGAVVASPLAAQSLVRVPQDAALQTAFSLVSDGGIIEISAGTYSGGFQITSQSKSYTVRAALGSNPVLDGGGAQDVLFMNNSGPVTFIGLTFRNGHSTGSARSGGVTVKNSVATFVDCIFEDNVISPASSNGGGGGVQLVDADAFFTDCVWQNNSAKNFGGGMAVFESTAWVHNSQVLTNRANLVGHITTATGGGFTVSASDQAGAAAAKLRVSNTRFQDNETGFAGGGIYSIGQWVDPLATPRADVLAANCTFEGNKAEPHPSVTPPSSTEGGGIHSENQATTRVFNSRFLKNEAQIGGGVNLYRAIVEVHDSVFRGNRATGVASGGFGGAISGTSNDTLADGTTNRRSASLTVTDTLIQGQFEEVTGAVAQVGGGIFFSGDVTRNYGLGITQLGTPAVNRAPATIDGVAIYDCEAEGTGGGGLAAELLALTVQDSLIMGSQASTLQGGGLRIASETDASVDNSCLAKNTGGSVGGGAYVSGSEFDLSNSNVFENDSPSGSGLRVDPKANVFGAGVDADVTGVVSGSTFSNNTSSLTLLESDFNDGPINDLRYNGNSFHFSGSNLYWNTLGGMQTTAGLNSLTVTRSGAANTDKSQTNNTDLGTAPIVASLLAVPPHILPVTAAGDAASMTESFLAYAWSGGSATLDGSPVAGNVGLQSDAVGSHTLNVDGTPLMTEITAGPAPAATFTANLGPGEGSYTLTWNVTAGTFLDMAIDQGVVVTPAASGSVVVTPTAVPKTYRLFVVTEEGGVVEDATANDPNLIFSDGFESGDVSAWSASVP